jgi:hypothetical protein
VSTGLRDDAVDTVSTTCVAAMVSAHPSVLDHW